MKSIATEWKEAYDKAEYYKSDRNSEAFWETLVGQECLVGHEHVDLLMKELDKLGVFTKDLSLCDIGCGSGDYTVAFADKLSNVTAFDCSRKMLDACKDKCEKNDCVNVNYIHGDFDRYAFPHHFDVCISCLNPTMYNPDSFQKLIDMSDKFFVYMTMDIPMDVNELESEYCGTNSIHYAEQYVKEHHYKYLLVPYTYVVKSRRSTIKVPFVFLIGKK